jgi:hypothetical protein
VKGASGLHKSKYESLALSFKNEYNFIGNVDALISYKLIKISPVS